MTDTDVRPLLKWAGGKRQLLPALRAYYPASFGRYIEPFFGSGAVFFDLWRLGRLNGRRALLIDSNPDLIGCYLTVRDHTLAVGDELERLADAHARHDREHYYAVRDEFNRRRSGLRIEDGGIGYTPALAAMLLYLNRTGFNGLFRVNGRGAFNVPAGRYLRPRIVDRDRLRETAAALSSSGVELRWGSFAQAADVARRGDFLYVDPPYAPLSGTANFTAYTSAKFGDAEQLALQRMVLELARRGCHLLLSNSTAPLIRELYDGNTEARGAGLHAVRVPARRAINRDARGRGPVDEYLITNIERSAGT